MSFSNMEYDEKRTDEAGWTVKLKRLEDTQRGLESYRVKGMKTENNRLPAWKSVTDVYYPKVADGVAYLHMRKQNAVIRRNLKAMLDVDEVVFDDWTRYRKEVLDDD